MTLKQKTKSRKLEYIKDVKFEVKLEVGDILSNLNHNNVSLKQILIQIGASFMWDGANALTGLPIITNERSCAALENAIICKYVSDNWDKILKEGIKYFRKLHKAKVD